MKNSFVPSAFLKITLKALISLVAVVPAETPVMFPVSRNHQPMTAVQTKIAPADVAANCKPHKDMPKNTILSKHQKFRLEYKQDTDYQHQNASYDMRSSAVFG